MNETERPKPGVIGSVSVAAGRLRRNPILLVGALVLTALGGIISLLGVVHPLLVNLTSIVWIVVWPFLIAGFLGMVVDARTGPTRLGTFATAGKANYLSMLGATLLFAGIIFGVIFFSFVLTFVLFLIVLASTAGELLEGGITVLFVAATVLFVLPYLLIYLFVQFYDVGVVAGGERAVSSLTHSVSLVRQNIPGVVGYTVVFILIQMIGYGPGYAVLFLGGVELTDAGGWRIVSASLFAVGSLLTLVFGTVAMALAFTYHVTFYEAISPDTGERASTDSSA